MSKFEIKMSRSGESITEGTIISQFVKVGDMIQEDNTLFEANTAKVSMKIPSPVAGKAAEILYKEDGMTAIGTVVAIIDLNGEKFSETEPIDVSEVSPSLTGTTRNESANTVSKPAAVEEERWYSPIVIQLAWEAKVPKEGLDAIQGTGYEGRLSKKDIKDYTGKRKRGGNVESKLASVVAAPATSKTSVTVSSEQAGPKVIPVAMPEVGVKEMDRVRWIIADHAAMPKRVSPHVTNVVKADATELICWREKDKDASSRYEEVRLTYTPAIMEAVVKALAIYPQVSVSADGYNILFKKRVNTGITASLNDGNLIVPVVHDADHLNLNGLTITIDSLALKAKDDRLMPEDIDGDTFTIINFGALKSLLGTLITNQPQVAILGTRYIEKKPAVVEASEDDTITIRYKMYLPLPYDHRVVDGMLGGNFLHFIADYLENWKG